MYQVPLEMICRHDRTAEVCRAAVEEDGWQLENVPEEMKTPERVRVAVETSGMSAVGRGGVPKSLLTPDVYVRCAAHSRE